MGKSKEPTPNMMYCFASDEDSEEETERDVSTIPASLSASRMNVSPLCPSSDANDSKATSATNAGSSKPQPKTRKIKEPTYNMMYCFSSSEEEESESDIPVHHISWKEHVSESEIVRSDMDLTQARLSGEKSVEAKELRVQNDDLQAAPSRNMGS
jgi:hypothetical protein